LLGAVFLACVPTGSEVSAPSNELDSAQGRKPRLLVLITVDQLRADYLDRWSQQLTGGLGRLMRGGTHFPVAVHDHAISATSPGHATIASGRHPVNTGIMSNERGVADINAPLLASVGPGASPWRFRGTTLADWMSSADARTRIFSTAYKGRSAILHVGRRRAEVYWYNVGMFTTSTYYRNALPEWVQRFNNLRLPASYAARTWTLLLPDSAYPEPDNVASENGGSNFLFPHSAADTPDIAPILLESTPWIDELTFRFALHGVRSLALGQGPQSDLLAISLSGTDLVGHTYGPDSREVHDQILRLDQSLGAFLDSLFTIVDEREVIVALTSDHGIAPFNDVPGHDNRVGGYRISATALVAPIRAGLQRRGLPSSALRLDFGSVLLDWSAFRRSRIDVDSVMRELRAHALRTPGIARVDRPSELARADTVRDVIARRWLHTVASDSIAPLVITVARDSYWTPGADANHASPHDYDVHVPLILFGRPFAARRMNYPVRMVDLAPTLARILGITPTERLDGRALVEVAP
jgi:arylsulfatase A-like enzyme